MADWKLVSYQTEEGARAGVVHDDRVHDLARLTGNGGDMTMRGFLGDWERGRRRLAAALARGPGDAGVPLAETRLLAPVPEPGAIYCAGANYRDHAAEMSARENRPPDPDPHALGLTSWHFIKSNAAVTHPGATIQLPRASRAVDWEVELAAVIGRAAKDVPVSEALGHVAGYLCANDLSARDLGTRAALPATNPFRLDWLAHKSFDGSCPLGPWIVPAEAPSP